jgi:hypothetical protein
MQLIEIVSENMESRKKDKACQDKFWMVWILLRTRRFQVRKNNQSMKTAWRKSG